MELQIRSKSLIRQKLEPFCWFITSLHIYIYIYVGAYSCVHVNCAGRHSKHINVYLLPSAQGSAIASLATPRFVISRPLPCSFFTQYCPDVMYKPPGSLCGDTEGGCGIWIHASLNHLLPTTHMPLHVSGSAPAYWVKKQRFDLPARTDVMECSTSTVVCGIEIIKAMVPSTCAEKPVSRAGVL